MVPACVFSLALADWTPRLETLAVLLSTDERTRCERFRRPADAQRYVLARGGLRLLLAQNLGADPRQLRFTVGPHGKPALAGGDGGDWRFSVSHSHGLVLLALGRGGRELGVDVERVDPARAVLPLAARFFLPPEHAALAAEPDAAPRTAAFFRLWTRKEACAKADSRGLATVLPHAGPSPLAPTPPAGLIVAGRWRVFDLPLPTSDHAAALALAGAESAAPPVLRPLLPPV